MQKATSVKVGATLVSNDKRTKGKTIKVLEIAFSPARGHKAVYHTGKRKQRIRFADIFPPGTDVARGWNIKA